jgi:hypothetical protein
MSMRRLLRDFIVFSLHRFEERSNFFTGFDCEEEFLITCMGFEERDESVTLVSDQRPGTKLM